MSVSIGFWILYFNPKGACVKGWHRNFENIQNVGGVFPALKIWCETDTVMQESALQRDLPL